MYKYNAGGQNGNITFIWNIGDEIDQTQQHKTVKEVEKIFGFLKVESRRKRRGESIPTAPVSPQYLEETWFNF